MRSVATWLRGGVAAMACLAIWTGAQGAEGLRTAKSGDLQEVGASSEVFHVSSWAVQGRDAAGRTFAVVDKVAGRLFVFDGEGRLLGTSPVLVGATPGDTSAPDIGKRQISGIRPDERTTPAGRFEARMGVGPKGEDILWVDYENALALHRVVTHVPQERRLQRLASNVASERRITYGCINVPEAFYDRVIRPAFALGGVVYILPEQRRAQEFFGSHEAAPPQVLRTSATASPTLH